MACWTCGARAVAAITTVGSDAPPGKCAASMSNPVTESASTRNCSVCDRPMWVVNNPVADAANMVTASAQTGPGRRPTASATRCQTPVADIGGSPARGMNGQNTFRPHSASSGGKANNTNKAATASPQAAQIPRLRVLGVTAAISVSKASTTVALLARMAGPAARTARRNAARRPRSLRSSSR